MAITPSAAIGGGTFNAANYAITFVNGSLTVNPATLTVTADNKSKVQGDVNPLLTSTIVGLQNGETSAVVSGLTLSTTALTGSPVGIYPITPSGASAANYVFVYVNGVLTVTESVSNINPGIFILYEALGEDGSTPTPLSGERDAVKSCGTVDGGLPASAGGEGVVCASIINLDRHASNKPRTFSSLTPRH